MKKDQRGFLQIIIVIIIALALLKFVFDFNIIDFIKKPKVAETISYIWNDIILFLWNNYIEGPFFWAFKNVKLLAKIGWENFIFVLDKIKEIIIEIKK